MLKHVLQKGEVISDHLNVIEISGLSRSILERKNSKNGIIWEFFHEGEGVFPIPKCICQNTDKKWKFLWEPKMQNNP